MDALTDRRPLALVQRLRRSLDAIEPGALSPRDYATLQTLRWELDGAAEARAYVTLDFSLLAPRLTPLTEAFQVLGAYPLGSAQALEDYLFLLDGVSLWLLDARGALQARAAERVFASADVTRSARAFLVRLRDDVARGDFRVADARVQALDTALVRAFRDQEAEESARHVQPAIDSLIRYLDTYTARALPRPGLWQYPGGKEFYRHLLRRNLGVEIEPEEAHRAGLSELRRVDSLLSVVRRQMGWTGSIRALHDSLRLLPQNRAVPVDSVIARARAELLRARDSLTAHAGWLPPALPTIRGATAGEALFSPDGDVVPPATGENPQVLVTQAWGTVDGRAEGPSLLYRWTWPGLALAATVGQRSDAGNPALVLHPSIATRLGWSEYAGSLAGEAGLYADPLAAYGRLLHEGLNAALLVSDTGLHYFGWSRAQAVAVLRPYSLASEAALDSLFVERVVQTPGVGGAATIGAREHAAMRAWMQRVLGPRFDAAAWHHEVMSLGPVPLPVLASYLEWWGWDQRRRAATPR